MTIESFKEHFSKELEKIHSVKNFRQRRYSKKFKEGISSLHLEGYSFQEIRNALGFKDKSLNFQKEVLDKKLKNSSKFVPINFDHKIPITQPNYNKSVEYEFDKKLLIRISY